MILNVNLATEPLETHRRFRVFSAIIGMVAATLCRQEGEVERIPNMGG